MIGFDHIIDVARTVSDDVRPSQVAYAVIDDAGIAARADVLSESL
jgi:hypothetical protein